MSHLEDYWTKRYEENNTGWNIGYPSTPIKEYISQLANKDIQILIPGAGNAYEAEFLYENGFTNVYVLDISELPLTAFKKRLPSFPEDNLLHMNFFDLEQTFDLIIEQTFFCSFEPTTENRSNYAEKMNTLLKPKGKLVGLWFKHPLVEDAKRPFGGNKDEYLKYMSPYFDVNTFEACHNSIPERQGKELFGIFIKKI